MSNRQGVLLVSVDALPQVGGVSMMAHHMANAFAQQSRPVILLCPEGSYVPSDLARQYALYEDDYSQVQRRAGHDGRREDQRITHLVRAISKEYNIGRILLMHPFYYGIGSLEAARQLQIKSSMYFHGYELRSQLAVEPYDGCPLPLSFNESHSLAQRTYHSISEVDEILVNSSFTAALFKGMRVRHPPYVTGCGIDAGVFERECAFVPNYENRRKEKHREQFGLPKVKFAICFVGRLSPSKRVDWLIRMIAHSAKAHAFIAGDGTELNSLKELAHQLNVSERVHFFGRVDESRKWEILRSSNALSLLSENNETTGNVEGFGIVLLEAAAAGAVPISSGTGGMVDVVRDGETGIVIDRPDAAAMERVERTLSNNKRAGPLVAGARREIEKRFNWTSIGAKLSEKWGLV